MLGFDKLAGNARRFRMLMGMSLQEFDLLFAKVEKMYPEEERKRLSKRSRRKTLCVAVISATVVPALLDLRVDNTLPRMRAFVRLTRGMRIVKYRFDGEWEFSAGQVRYTAKEVRICITLE